MGQSGELWQRLPHDDAAVGHRGVPVFRGRFEHTIDEKGRLAVPARFRDLVLAGAESATLVITNSEHCLAAYPLNEWERLEKKVAELPQFDPKIAAFKRIFIGCAQECSIDRSGRVLIPADLRRDAKIDQSCVIIGQITKFEVWSASRWESMFAQVSDQFSTISAALGERGIQL